MELVMQQLREGSVTSSTSDASSSSCIVVGGLRPAPETIESATEDITSSNEVFSLAAGATTSTLSVTRQRSSHRDVSPTNAFAPQKPESRTLSGETLVAETFDIEETFEQNIGNNSCIDSEVEEEKSSSLQISSPLQRKKSTRLTLAAKVTMSMVSTTASTLGKRSAAMFESSRDKLETLKRSSSRIRPSSKQSESREVEDMEDVPQRKRRKLLKQKPNSFKQLPDERPQRIENAMHRYKGKLWLTSGLYVGQELDFNPKIKEARRKDKTIEKISHVAQTSSFIPPPMFAGKRLLENGRDFKLPFDICSPLPPGQSRPDMWRKTQKNVFVGDAASEWRHHKHLPPSRCLCSMETGCDEDCQNRYMLYECDDANCNVGQEKCTNRAFADLKVRSKSGNKYDVGVEVVKTAEKGFGVRSNRMFEPNQIIMEYAGEIITQEECERRMIEEYKNNECYYLMVFDQNMIIDATRGSMARFVNHSCEPNCRMVKWTVAGKPRMALFAGEEGIMTGEELTYDYNFDPFSQKNVQVCRCGAPSCRGILGPRTAEKVLPKITETIVVSAKRRFQEIFGSDHKNSQSSHDGKQQSKDGRKAFSSFTEPAKFKPSEPKPIRAEKKKPSWYWEPVKDTKKERTMSSKTGGSTLIDKENILPRARLRRSSLQSAASSVQSGRSIKRTPPKQTRRRTISVLSR